MPGLQRLLNSTYFFALWNISFNIFTRSELTSKNDRRNIPSGYKVFVQQFVGSVNEYLGTKMII
jgi:hypothetical protein